MKPRHFFAIVSLVWMIATLAACAGGEKDVTPQAPASVAQLARLQNLSGADAGLTLDSFHIKTTASSEVWAASYGEGDRIWVYATGLPTPEDARTALASMQRAVAQAGESFGPMQAATIAQQPGFRTKDNEDQKHIFVFTRGRWMVGVRGIVIDLEPAVASIVWAE